MPKPLQSITLGEMLAWPNAEVSRHAHGALKAIQKELKRLSDEQDEEFTS